MVTHNRPMHHATLTELRRTQGTLARIASALLTIGLLGRTRNFAHAFGFVGAGTALGQLPMHHTRHDVSARRGTKQRFRQFDLTSLGVLEGDDRGLHLRLVHAMAAGKGASAWRARFTASRTST